MKKVKEQIKQSELLVGKLLGTLTDEEKQRLQQWEEVAANKETETDILNADAFKDWNEKRDRLNTSEQWEQFVVYMDNANRKPKVIRMNFFRAIASIAAVLAIGFFAYLNYQQAGFEEGYQTVSQSNIAHGSPHAKLILADGKEVNLANTNVNVIAQGSMNIENEKGILSYNEGKESKSTAAAVNTLKIPRGGEYQLVLSDGTKVWLNSDTELTYAVSFSEKERRVRLKGEAYFEVAHNKAKPFIVESDNQDIEVLGTHFNVSAYQDDANIVTTLVEGKVKVESTVKGHSKIKEFLLPNDQLVLNKINHGAYKQKVETDLYTSWKEGRFVFNKEPIESFFKKLSRWYNVDIVITDESIKKINFTGDLPRYKNMADILKVVEAEMSVRIKIKDNKVVYVTR
ncbi:FecR family protein [Flavobacterium granuli]|uniref:FecR family protein n=1 Tax=Flavobacterium granuli TaxID=280093 RepID=A0A1M5S9C7_9FLAO|nr:FecR domain-containing protein [Flavobacterium granuli]PRZ21249.1 FecR family protein [Flavobacterium granuli]SHH34888.1 FecR family protein [Flavobacterium granuli]